MRWDLILPNPTIMWQRFTDNPWYFLENWWSTFSVSICASALSLLVAIALSVAGLRYPVVERALSPLVAISQSFPLQAIAPLLLIALGTGFHSKLVIALLIALLPIYEATASALRATPKAHVAHLRVLKARFLDGIILVRLPAALPAIVAATKVGFTLAVLGAVVAEFIQPDKGLGRVILAAQSQFDANIIYVCITLLALQGGCIYLTLTQFERRLTSARASLE